MLVNPALRIFEDGSEVRALPRLEVVKRKVPGIQGRLKFLGHLSQELLIELRRQAHIVPHIRVVLNELIELEHARDVIACVIAGKILSNPTLNLGILGIDAKDLSRRIDRGILVVLAIRQHGIMQVNSLIGTRDNLKGE